MAKNFFTPAVPPIFERFLFFNFQSSDEKISVPVTAGEFVVMRQLMLHSLPHLVGFDVAFSVAQNSGGGGGTVIAARPVRFPPAHPRHGPLVAHSARRQCAPCAGSSGMRLLGTGRRTDKGVAQCTYKKPKRLTARKITPTSM